MKNIIRFRADYKISSPPPGADTPEFQQAIGCGVVTNLYESTASTDARAAL